jgi:hypothetical protein
MTGMSATATVVMVILIILALASLEIVVFGYGGRSYRPHRTDRRRGDVRGAMHMGDPGSVSPQRDAPANTPGRDATVRQRRLVG